MMFLVKVLILLSAVCAQIFFMVGCGLLKPDPVQARSDTPKRLKALCLKCCRFERTERPNFLVVSHPGHVVRSSDIQEQLVYAHTDTLVCMCT